MLNYSLLQKGVQKQMKGVDKSELKVNKDLTKTEKEIKKLKRNKGKNIFTSMLGGVQGFVFAAIGGLILITLARVALRKWKKAYMPKTDKSTMTIFGVKIPGWAEMKALGIGIYNFFTVGIPIYWEKLKGFFAATK